MPEIAEVETVRRTLKEKIYNHKIIDFKIMYPKMIINDLNEFEKIKNQTFKDVLRIGKWLIFELDDYYLLSHLRMEGKFFIRDSGEDIYKHEHVIFNLDNKSDLRYHDVRKFGQMLLTTKDHLYDLEQIKKQGIEANDSKLNVLYLKEKFENKRLPIKSCLLDQTIISGLGNIYADEVLFHAKINPLKMGKSLNNPELQNIITCSKEVTDMAISMGGTTIRSYTSSLGVTGRFQQELKVHKRENEPCFNCGTQIVRIKVGGRSTYFCPKCQKED